MLIRVLFLMLSLVLVTPGPAAAQAQIDIDAAMTERVLGDPNAPVTVVEYASLTCPHCANFHNDTFKAFKARYIDTGQVRMVYRDFPLDGVALRAAALARCTEGETYFDLIQLMYRSQAEWSRARDPLGELAKLARLAGVEQDRFEACTTSERLLNGVLFLRPAGCGERRAQHADLLNQRSEVYPGARSIAELAAIIDPLLAAAK